MELQMTRVTTQEECEQCRRIAEKVWGADAGATALQMSVHASYGGVILLAWDGSFPVGFLYSFPARYHDEWVLWSHETGILPDYQQHGIGERLKRRQFELAAGMGYRAIAWTYDPLVARNAYFNLSKLHATVKEYKVNAYGSDPTDLVNQGLETDRFVAYWPLPGCDTPATSPQTVPDQAPRVLELGEEKSPLSRLQRLQQRPAFVSTSIPLDFTELLRRDWQTARKWRNTFRDVALQLLGQGYEICDFARNGDCGAYLWVNRG